MNNFLQNYMSFDGRISRKTWWLASIALAVVVVIIEFIIQAILGGTTNIAAAVTSSDPAAASAAIADGIKKAAWVGLIVTIVFGYPILALGIKRRHDRDNSGLDVKIIYGVAVLVNLLQALGLGMSTMDVNGVAIPTPSLPFTVISFLLGIAGIYLLVVLGFLRGTTGANQYGPDPLLAASPAAA
jgi:uncharacterized membrane protein YhaH (DUF805 family)